MKKHCHKEESVDCLEAITLTLEKLDYNPYNSKKSVYDKAIKMMSDMIVEHLDDPDKDSLYVNGVENIRRSSLVQASAIKAQELVKLRGEELRIFTIESFNVLKKYHGRIKKLDKNVPVLLIFDNARYSQRVRRKKSFSVEEMKFLLGSRKNEMIERRVKKMFLNNREMSSIVMPDLPKQ